MRAACWRRRPLRLGEGARTARAASKRTAPTGLQKETGRRGTAGTGEMLSVLLLEGSGQYGPGICFVDYHIHVDLHQVSPFGGEFVDR